MALRGFESRPSLQSHGPEGAALYRRGSVTLNRAFGPTGPGQGTTKHGPRALAPPVDATEVPISAGAPRAGASPTAAFAGAPLTTSLLQDCVETFLRIVAEDKKIVVSASADFATLLQRVEDRYDIVAGYRAALTSLNKARVAFKHHGQSVASANDVQVFVGNVESFLTDVCDNVLGIDFATLSLAGAIGHRRTQNWLAKAEDALAAGSRQDTVNHAAVAMQIYMAHDGVGRPPLGHRLSLDFSHESRDMVRFGKWVVEQIGTVQGLLGLAARGVDLASYDKFTMLAPRVSFTLNGRPHFGLRTLTPEPAWEDARFCIDFVVDAALALGESRLSTPRSDTEPEPRVTVTTPCNLVVYPTDDDLEVIREVEPGEELALPPAGRLHPNNNPEFVAVIQDGDVAYVRRDCVEASSSAASVVPDDGLSA